MRQLQRGWSPQESLPNEPRIESKRHLADVTVMGRTPAQRVFLLSTASLSPIGSYAQLLIYGEESLSPEGGMLSMKFT